MGSVLPVGYRMCPVCEDIACRMTEPMCRTCWVTSPQKTRDDAAAYALQNVFTFTIEGDPVPKGRPRFNRSNGRVITPKRTRDYEEHVGWAARSNGVIKMEGDVAVWLDLAFCRNKDIDNIAKSILDGMNGIAYDDDSQVAFLQVKRKRVTCGKGYAFVRIEAINEEVTE